jgi:uncharacterized protein
LAAILELIVPREKKFYDLLENLSNDATKCSEQLLFLSKTYEKSSSKMRKEIVDKMKITKSSCDRQKHEIMVELNKTFLTPIDREDIHKLASLLQDITDTVYNVSYKAFIYDLKKTPKFMEELADNTVQCAKEATKIIQNMAGKKKIEGHIETIHSLEKEADEMRNNGLAYVFGESLSAVDIIKLKDLYEALEAISDKYEEFADQSENIVIKYA